MPGASYKVNDTTCREYVHVIVADGRSETGRGTACRGANGNWQTGEAGPDPITKVDIGSGM